MTNHEGGGEANKKTSHQYGRWLLPLKSMSFSVPAEGKVSRSAIWRLVQWGEDP